MYAATAQPQASRPPFTQIDNAILFALLPERNLLGTYLALKQRCWNSKPWCNPKIETLAGELDADPGTVRSWLRALESRGYIQIKRTGRASRYHLTRSERVPAPLPIAAGDAIDKKQIKGTRSKKHNKRPAPAGAAGHIAIPQRSCPAPRGVVVFPKDLPNTPGTLAPLPPAVATRLEALGTRPTPTLVSFIVRYDSEALARAVACLEAYRENHAVPNPAGFLRRALEGSWTPPANFTAVRERKVREQAARRETLTPQIAQLEAQLLQRKTPEDLAREVDGLIEAEQERRRLFGSQAPLAGQALADRRAQLRERVQRQWDEEDAARRRRVEILALELAQLDRGTIGAGGASRLEEVGP